MDVIKQHYEICYKAVVAGERRTTFLDEYAFRRALFVLVLAHFSLCLPLIFNLLMQSSITLVARDLAKV